MVKSLDFDDKAVFTGHQFILQLGYFSLVRRLCKVVAQDVDQQVKQDHTGKINRQGSEIKKERER